MMTRGGGLERSDRKGAVDTLIDMLDHAAATTPGKAAVIDETQALTFAGLAQTARALAIQVSHLSDRPRVGLLLPSGAGFAASFFGVLLAGRAPVPLNLLLTAGELAFCIRDADIDLILTVSPLADRAAALTDRVLVVDQQPSDRPAVTAVPAPSPEPSAVAALLYTSGTTARPKGVRLTHANLLANAEACRQAAALDESHVLLGLLPLFHTLGLMGSLILPAYLRATSILLTRFEPEGVMRALERHRPTALIAIPSMYGVMLRTGMLAAADTSSLRLCIAGGEPLPEPISTAFLAQTGRPLMEGYGLTETSPVVTLNPPPVPGSPGPRPGTAGPPLPGVSVRVVDPAGRDVPCGQEGEVWIRGPSVMAGYHNRPDETALCLTADGWFKSGDLGRLDGDGYLAITGRLKDLIISSGENISPGEIEEVLLRHPAVAEAAVIGLPDALRGEVPKAFVVCREGMMLTAKALRDWCRENLAPFKVPREIEFREALPKGPTGKVQRRALRETPGDA